MEEGDAAILEPDFKKVHAGGPAWENNAVRKLAIIHYDILDMDGTKSVDKPVDRITSRARLLILEERSNKGFDLRARPTGPPL